MTHCATRHSDLPAAHTNPAVFDNTLLTYSALVCRMRSGGTHHAAVCHSHEMLVAGTIQSEAWEETCTKLQGEVHEAQKIRGNKRNAARNEQGHQKTPAFVYALLQQVVQQSSERVQPQGCLSDVGLHTGGRPRGTCWPLVRSVLLVRSQTCTSRHDAVIDSLRSAEQTGGVLRWSSDGPVLNW